MVGTQEKLRSMLQFLAISSAEQLAYLPPFWPWIDYLIDDTGDRTDNPLYYFTYRTWEFLERHDFGEDEFGRAVRDVWTVLTIMFDPGYEYIWIPGGPTEKSVSGPADGLWNVIRRLAGQALLLRGWETKRPELPFEQIIYVSKLGPSTRGKDPKREWSRLP
jgi:hypothetical protein